MPLDISEFSRQYNVRRMYESDADTILALCRKNTQYYAYCGKNPSKELILNDLTITPPGKDFSSKYYVGFYERSELIAVMDLIDGYPDADTAFIGFFLMNPGFFLNRTWNRDTGLSESKIKPILTGKCYNSAHGFTSFRAFIFALKASNFKHLYR